LLKAESEKIGDYEVIKNLELSLRNLIVAKLLELTEKWWIERIPSDVRENAEKRMRKEESIWPWMSAEERDYPIAYINFSDYSKIILRRDNWRDVFKYVFKDEDFIRARLKELEYIRNKVMHFRSLSRDEKGKLLIYAREVMRCIDEALG